MSILVLPVPAEKILVAGILQGQKPVRLKRAVLAAAGKFGIRYSCLQCMYASSWSRNDTNTPITYPDEFQIDLSLHQDRCSSLPIQPRALCSCKVRRVRPWKLFEVVLKRQDVTPSGRSRRR